MSGNKSVMIEKWKKESRFLLKSMYPNANDETIEKYLNNLLKEHYINEEVKCYNNYDNFTKTSTCADIENFYYSKHKPIATEHGTFFDGSVDSPVVLMLSTEKKERKEIKHLRDQCDKDSYEYTKYDNGQGNKKVAMNSYYGGSGAPSFIFYNIHCATATTGKGRAIISTATQAFESFLSNNSTFRDNGECVTFIKNCINFARKTDILKYIDSIPSKSSVLKKLVKTYYRPYKKHIDKDLIMKLLNNCDDNELSAIYFKNNFYTFMDNSSLVRTNIKNIIMGCDNFVDPNKPPKHIIGLLEETWHIIEQAVHYDHMIMDKVYRLQNRRRKSIVVIDTDSNMINMHPFVKYAKENILHHNYGEKSSSEVRYNSLSTISFILTKVITKTFKKFTKFSNIKKEKWDLLKMKNEYLYKRMLISPGKKNYVGSIEFKEGKWMDFKLDVKGLPIDKISSNAQASEFFKSIVKRDILESDDIDIPEILSKLQEFQDAMENSLRSGELTFLKPSRVKEARYYDNPLSEQPVRASYLWNELSDEIKIEPPDSVFIIKMLANKLDKIEPMKIAHPEMYERIKERVFESDVQTIKDKGLYVIAIPRNMEEVPDWIIPYIDVDTIIHDNMKNIIRILESLGLHPISKRSNEKHFSGMVTL